MKTKCKVISWEFLKSILFHFKSHAQEFTLKFKFLKSKNLLKLMFVGIGSTIYI